MAYSNFSELPEGVRKFIASPEISQGNGEIADIYGLNRDQMAFLLGLERSVFFKSLPVLDLPNHLEDMERAEYYDLRAITLDMAYKILWPLQDFLEDVDRLILRLGGKVPRWQHLPQSENETGGIPASFDLTIREAIEQYSGFKDSRLTNSKIIDKEGRLVAPTIDNWIKDYIHFTGAGQHGSLERAKYLSKNANALALNEADKESLRFVLISYDDDAKVQIDTGGFLVKISEFKKAEAPVPVKNTKELLDEIEQRLMALDSRLLSGAILMSEAGGDAYKLRDVLWQALGLLDKDKVVSCLRLLIERRALDAMIKEDNRFINVLRRFISVRFGYSVEHNFDQNQDLAISRRLFFEMILADKLALGADTALVAFYLTNILEGDTPLVYFDEAVGELRWRALQVLRDKLVWLDELDIVA
ncbi:MAG: hypothetical protein C3F02_02695 [Parcubacteria group bacterium]|nr:MAG: hypothetical protein C3F02_02695 [Parcubacteria group bacterium]